MTFVVGREAEFRAVTQLLDDIRAGDPAVLLLAGEPGIGKTTVWRAGVEAARERQFATLISQPASNDVRLSYAGLSDLLADVPPEAFAKLPPPQRRALDAALLRSSNDVSPPDSRAVAAGLVSVLNELAQACPVVLAIDDIQWLDAPSLNAVEFAVRRCRGPIAILLARREDAATSATPVLRPRDAGRTATIPIGPLSPGALHGVLRERLGRPVPRPALGRLIEASGGNPFFALELARHLDASPQGVLALPPTLHAAVQQRLARLEPPVLDILRTAAALAAPTVETIARAFGPDAERCLPAAEEAGVLDLLPDGRVRFTHPLLAAGVLSDLTANARRTLHRRLSGAVDDPEERARHLALATVGPDPGTINALDEAATRARKRGAPGAAAELLELALGLGAEPGQRAIAAAQDHFKAGNLVRARELLEEAVSNLPPGPGLAEALGTLGLIRFELEGVPPAIELLERAVLEAHGNPRLRVSLRIDLAFLLFVGGRIPESNQQAVVACQEAEGLETDGLLAEALAAVVIVRYLSGGGTDEQALARALELEDRDATTSARRWPSTVATQIYRWTHRLDRAEAAFAALRERCLAHGLESDLWFISLGAIPAACWAGHTAAARALVDDALERARIAESPQLLGLAHLFEAQYAAWVGEIGEARRAGANATSHLGDNAPGTIVLELPAALGMAELAAGDIEAALAHLGPAAEAALAMGFEEPASAQFLPDAAEALLATGRHDEAAPLVELLERSGRQPERPWARAVGARCRGLLLAATNRLDEADTAYAEALAAHDELPQLAYDRGRTLLAIAALRRRTGQRRAALSALEEARKLFERVGSGQWARQATGAAAKLGLRPGAGERLTPVEEDVATLAASGKTNREIAASLFMSPKTVDAHLGRIYKKLGIRTRAELGWRMAERAQD